MRNFLKFIIVILVIVFTSCDALEGPFTTNYFEPYSDTNPFSIVLNETWDPDNDEECTSKIDSYTSAALSKDDSEIFFRRFKTLGDEYRTKVTTYWETLLAGTVPVKTSETYYSDLLLYQRRSLALGKLEIYTREAIAIDGFKEFYLGYTSGSIDEVLTMDLFLEIVFDRLVDPSFTFDELKEDLYGYYYAGQAFDNLGKTILNLDNPYSPVITTNEGIEIFIACIINRTITLSLANTSNTEDVVISDLAEFLWGSVGTYQHSTIYFPYEVSLGSESGIDNIVEHYLGVGGALAYTATGFKMPPISDLSGGNQ